ncbi:MAG: hypothetical protein ABI885_28990 [Gammaproteobacteria bacterium]
MITNMKSLSKACVAPALAAAFAFSTVPAIAAQPIAVREASSQLKADQAALQRQLKRLQADQVRLKKDTASGRMSAESRDAYEVYNAQQATAGEAKVIAEDDAGSLQMKADEAALQRQIKRLNTAIARNKADYSEGKMAAESRDAEKVYLDKMAVRGEKKDLSQDSATLEAARKKK